MGLSGIISIPYKFRLRFCVPLYAEGGEEGVF